MCVSEEIALKAMKNNISILQDELCELHHEVSHAAEDIASLRSEVRELQERDEPQVDTITDRKYAVEEPNPRPTIMYLIRIMAHH